MHATSHVFRFVAPCTYSPPVVPSLLTHLTPPLPDHRAKGHDRCPRCVTPLYFPSNTDMYTLIDIQRFIYRSSNMHSLLTFQCTRSN
eukprot:1161076-Pelagomonas_calceolata.AAC.9